MEEFVIPAIIVGAIAAVNRIVEYTFKPVVKGFFDDNEGVPSPLYSIVMTLIAIVVGMFTYWQTPGLIQAFDETFFSMTPSLPVVGKFIFAGIALWVGADFIRPVFAVLNLVNSLVDRAKAIADAVREKRYNLNDPIEPVESASAQIVRKRDRG